MNCNHIEAGHPESICDRCHLANVTWFAHNSSWNEVMRVGREAWGGQTAEEYYGGIVCPVCFIEIAGEVGVCSHYAVYREVFEDASLARAKAAEAKLAALDPDKIVERVTRAVWDSGYDKVLTNGQIREFTIGDIEDAVERAVKEVEK